MHRAPNRRGDKVSRHVVAARISAVDLAWIDAIRGRSTVSSCIKQLLEALRQGYGATPITLLTAQIATAHPIPNAAVGPRPTPGGPRLVMLPGRGEASAPTAPPDVVA